MDISSLKVRARIRSIPWALLLATRRLKNATLIGMWTGEGKISATGTTVVTTPMRRRRRRGRRSRVGGKSEVNNGGPVLARSRSKTSLENTRKNRHLSKSITHHFQVKPLSCSSEDNKKCGLTTRKEHCTDFCCAIFAIRGVLS